MPAPQNNTVMSGEEEEPAADTETDPEVARRYAFWPPSAATAQILSGVAAAAPGTFYPDRASLTTPAVVLREDLPDPVRNLVAHYRGEQEASRRQVLTADSVTQDQRGLRQLVRAGCLRAAVSKAKKLSKSPVHYFFPFQT